jgi:hypothetical protein
MYPLSLYFLFQLPPKPLAAPPFSIQVSVILTDLWVWFFTSNYFKILFPNVLGDKNQELPVDKRKSRPLPHGEGRALGNYIVLRQ